MTETKNRAWVSISSDFLAERLGLPKGVKIVRADTNGFDFGVRFGLEGPGLPAAPDGVEIKQILMLCTQEDHEGTRKIYGAWSHAPNDRWLIDERPAPPLPVDFEWRSKDDGAAQ